MKVGDVQTWERTFTEEDVQTFGQLSGSLGIQHVLLDELDRIMVQGLLTATLPTKIGADMNYTPRSMTFEFKRPVFVSDTIRCQVTITYLRELEGRIMLNATWRCTNQQGKEVLTGLTSGIIRIPSFDLVGRH